MSAGPAPAGGPLILALETATKRAGAALLSAETVLARAICAPDRPHAEEIIGLVDRVLCEAHESLSAVEAFAVAVGPGGFTSLRVGLSTVKGLAFATSRPVAAISTLAAQVQAAGGIGEPMLSVLDAKRGEFYGALYADPGHEPSRLFGEAVYEPEKLAGFADLPPATQLCGEGAPKFAVALRAASGLALPIRASRQTLAEAVGQLGSRVLARGKGQSAAAIEPRYLRRAQAEETLRGG